jgi:hypothetical protein
MQGFLAVTATLTLWEWCSGSCHGRCQRDGAAGKAAAAEPMLPLQHLTAAIDCRHRAISYCHLPSTIAFLPLTFVACPLLLLFAPNFTLPQPFSPSVACSRPLLLVLALWYDVIYGVLWYYIWYDMIWYGCCLLPNSLSLSLSRPFSLFRSFWIFLALSRSLYVCDMIWYDMIWYDMIWHDMTWYDMIWHDMTWYDMIWHDMTWYDMTWHDMTWYDMIWYNVFILCILEK